jgi:hypothetical protein
MACCILVLQYSAAEQLVYVLTLLKSVPLHTKKALGGEEIQLILIHDLGIRWG